MPELPEVETVVRSLDSFVRANVITQVSITPGGLRALGNYATPDSFAAKLVGRKVADLERKGKFIIFKFEREFDLIVHLRMTGKLIYSDPLSSLPNSQMHSRYFNPAHDRVVFALEKGNLVFNDSRRFGTMHLHNHMTYPGIMRLGPDALSNQFNADYLIPVLRKSKRPMYSALMDQSIVAGLGNIYVCEILHAAKIHPLEPASNINLGQIKALVLNTKSILDMAIKYNGTTFNSYTDSSARPGSFQKLLQVYGVKDSPDIVTIKINGRTVYFSKQTKLRK